MNLEKLIEELVLAVAINKEVVGVKRFETDDENTMLFQVLVANEDMARVIGKNGKVINSIRNLAQASSYLNENKLIKINVDSI